MFRRTTFAATLALLFTAASCGGDADAGTNDNNTKNAKADSDKGGAAPKKDAAPAAPAIAGSYSVNVDKSMAGLPEAMAPMKDMLSAMMSKVSLTLKEDNTFVESVKIEMGGMTQEMESTGNWTLDGNALTIEQTHENGQEKAETRSGTVDGGNLSITGDMQGQELTIHYQKKS